jgi:hypothetical protein
MRVLSPAAEWLAGPGPLAAHEVVWYVVTAGVWAPSVRNSQPRLAALTPGAERYGAMPRIIADQGAGAALAAAVEMAERAQRVGSEHVQELARRNGVLHTSYPEREERTFPRFPGRDIAHGRGWGLLRLDPGPAARAAGVVRLLATTVDRPTDWGNAGQALQRVLLTGAARGAAAALDSQPLELPWLRELIRTRFSNDSYPQMVLRLAAIIQTSVSVRRPPASVLFGGGSHG